IVLKKPLNERRRDAAQAVPAKRAASPRAAERPARLRARRRKYRGRANGSEDGRVGARSDVSARDIAHMERTAQARRAWQRLTALEDAPLWRPAAACEKSDAASRRTPATASRLRPGSDDSAARWRAH